MNLPYRNLESIRRRVEHYDWHGRHCRTHEGFKACPGIPDEIDVKTLLAHADHLQKDLDRKMEELRQLSEGTDELLKEIEKG